MNVWLPCPCHVVAPAILQSLIVPLCSPCGCCVVLAVSKCNTAKCSFSAVCPPWEACDQLRCSVCFRVSLLICSAPWLSGVLSELKAGFLQIVFSRICRRVHDNMHAPRSHTIKERCGGQNVSIPFAIVFCYDEWGYFCRYCWWINSFCSIFPIVRQSLLDLQLMANYIVVLSM